MKKLLLLILLSSACAIAQNPPSGSQTTKNTNGAFNNLYAKSNGSYITIKDTVLFSKFTIWKGVTTPGNPGTDTAYVYFRTSDNTLRIRYSSGADHNLDSAGTVPDSVRAAHFADTLLNVYQNVWKRDANGFTHLVFPADTVGIGYSSIYTPELGKLMIRMRDNGPVGINFGGDSGATNTNIQFLNGRMNNNRYWGLKHFSTNDILRLFIFTPPATTNTFMDFTTTGVGINTTPGAVLSVGGNTDIGAFNVTNSGSSNLRMRGQFAVGLNANEAVTTHSVVEQSASSTDDIFEMTNVSQTDTINGSHEWFLARPSLTFTSSSNQSIYTCSIGNAAIYNFEMTLIGSPQSDSGYFAKKIAVTAYNKTGTVRFDTTTIFQHLSGPSALNTCNFVVSTSGNTLVFNAVGSSTVSMKMAVSGWRRVTK